MSAASQVVSAERPALVVFGRDETNKPHASSFAPEEVDRATRAAALMGMRVMPINTDARRALAIRVPKGKVFASGKGFVPFVKAALFAELEGACRAESASEGDAPIDPPAAPDAKASASTRKGTPVPQPKDWSEIGVGAIVLTLSAPENCEWYEAVVTGIRGDRVTLRFADFPDRPPVQRQRKELGLMHPDHQPEPPLEATPPSAA
jgi:hypothetical protein